LTNINNAITANRLKGISLCNVLLLTAKGKIIADTHRINNIFTIFEPITLESIISACQFNAARILTKNSGIDVPKAIIVKPITIGGILNFLAILVDQSTNKFQPYNNT